jgi:TatD DNase family protein
MLKQIVKDREKLLVGNELSDVHCHLDMFKDPFVIAKDALFGGVSIIITAGGSEASSLSAVKMADGDNVFAVIGIDPQNAANDAGFVDQLPGIIKSNRRVVGIGEIGLDYSMGIDREIQVGVFERQIEIAKSLDVPIVVHSRKAISEVAELVKAHGVKKAVFHFFEGDENMASDLADLGYLISIPPIESSRRKRVINKLSIDSIVVETDSPAVGKSPLDVIKVVELVSEIKGIPFNETSMRITHNVKKLFSI